MITNKQRIRLINRAKLNMTFAHPKLSGYRVGACVLADNGVMYDGYNVETDIHLAIHAEMSAIHAMASDHNASVLAIAVACADKAWFPCGLCRQWINEYAASPSTEIFAVYAGGQDYIRSTIKELIPDGFKLKTPDHDE